MSNQATLADIEKALQKKSWWAMLFVLPVARRLSLLFINRTNISPNTITIGAFGFVLVSATCYWQGTYVGLLLGALFFELNYLFDCVDGTVARVKHLATPLGAYLDPMLDRVRVVLVALALAYGQYVFTGSMLIVFLMFSYVCLNNLILFTREAQAKALQKRGQGGVLGVQLARATFNGGLLAWWFKKTEDRNMMPYYHDIELDALVFVVGPLLNQVLPALVVANLLAVFLIIALNVMFFLSLRGSKGESGV